MSATPRLTDWTVHDAVLVAMRQERNALVAKVAAYESVLAHVRACATRYAEGTAYYDGTENEGMLEILATLDAAIGATP